MIMFVKYPGRQKLSQASHKHDCVCHNMQRSRVSTWQSV